MAIDILFPCDPSKNKTCKKTSCNNPCTMTADPTSAKENWLFKELRIIKRGKLEMSDALILKMVEAQSKEHEENLRRLKDEGYKDT